MSHSEFSVFETAKNLPENWDAACCRNPFLRQENLLVLEETNPCRQQYHFLETSDGLSVFVSYQHRLDIFTYGNGGFRIPVTMIAIPCSVSFAGHQLTGQGLISFERALQRIKGGVLVLNSPALRLESVCAKGTTLPNCELSFGSVDFGHYLQAMRSHYRYKVQKSRHHFEDVQISTLTDNRQFDRELYQLYEEVYQRSEFQLEKLPITFFQRFQGTITVFTEGGRPLGFCHTLLWKDELIFLFGGLNYGLNGRYHTYVNMLLYIIELGLERQVARINMGQTAEGIKTRLGCSLEDKYLYARHSNRLYNFLIQRSIRLLSYSVSGDSHHVFK